MKSEILSQQTAQEARYATFVLSFASSLVFLFSVFSGSLIGYPDLSLFILSFSTSTCPQPIQDWGV